MLNKSRLTLLSRACNGCERKHRFYFKLTYIDPPMYVNIDHFSIQIVLSSEIIVSWGPHDVWKFVSLEALHGYHRTDVCSIWIARWQTVMLLIIYLLFLSLYVRSLLLYSSNAVINAIRFVCINKRLAVQWHVYKLIPRPEGPRYFYII